MKLYGASRTRSDRVVWTLNELELEYEFVAIDFMKAEHRSPQFLRLNPNGKVPVLVDGDLVLYESAAICLYLAEKAPAKGLFPTDLVERAKCFQWLFFGCNELEAPLWTRARHSFVYPERRRVPAIFESCDWEFRKRSKTVEEALEGRQYLVGERFTLADLFISSMLAWGESQGLLTDNPICLKYVDRMKSRPAYPS
jgi:glutathione S-transferase